MHDDIEKGIKKEKTEGRKKWAGLPQKVTAGIMANNDTL